MSSIYRNPGRGKLSEGFRRIYPANPSQGFTFYQDEMQSCNQGLYYETAIGKAAIDALTHYVIGPGLVPMASPERDVLGWTEEETEQFQREAESFYRLVTGNASIDYYGKNPFRQLQQIAFKTICIVGDVLLHIGFRHTKSGVQPYVQVISGKYVMNPGKGLDTSRIVGGVEFDAHGKEIAYHVMITGENLEDTFRTIRCPRFTAKGRKSFDLISLGLSDPMQTRGVPVLNSVKDDILSMTKFKELHLAKAAVQALFTVFIEKTQDDEPGTESLKDKLKSISEPEYEETVQSSNEIALGAGNIIEGNPGEKFVSVESQPQASDFETYMKSILTLVAPAVGGMSYEMLVNSYNASFSASRATIGACEKNFRIIRDDFQKKFLEPVYRAVVEYGILTGHITAPGYMEGDNLYKSAVLASTWVGVTPVQVDPTKEVRGYADAIKANLCTHEQAIRALYGADADEVFQRLAKEKRQLEESGLAAEGNVNAAEADNGEEKEEEE